MPTAVTPCLLAGDRSLVDVVAHEIAHSWFGNLTTNATWADFFMNEGFTMYAQRRITQEVNGRVRASAHSGFHPHRMNCATAALNLCLHCSQAFTALEATTGQALLKQNIDDLGLDSPITCLHVPMEKVGTHKPPRQSTNRANHPISHLVSALGLICIQCCSSGSGSGGLLCRASV